MSRHITLKIVILLGFISLIPNQNLQAQKSWRETVGVHFLGDAEMSFFTISPMVGLDFVPSDKWTISTYGQLQYTANDSGVYWNVTASLLPQLHFGEDLRWYAGIGFAYQRTYSAFKGDDTPYMNRLFPMAAYKLGYTFYFDKISLSPEWSATGPYFEGSSVEIFTTFGIGLKLQVLNW